MSLREEMLAVYRNQYPDKVPLGIYTRYLPRSSVERQVRNLGMGIIDYFPIATMIGPPWHFYEGYLSEFKNTEVRIRYAWENGKRIERREFETPAGTLAGEIEYDPAGAGSEHIRKHYISSVEDYKIMTCLVDNTIVSSNEKAVQDKMSELGEDGVVMGRMDRNPYQKCLIELAGPERFLVDLFTDPEPVKGLMSSIERQLERQFAVALGSMAEVIWQPDNVTSDMTPPDAFREYCLPFYKKHSAEMISAEKPYVVHMDGKVGVLRKEIIESGFQVLESVSIPAMGGDLEIAEAQKNFPDIVVLPNFPSSWAVESSDTIRNMVRELLSSCVPEKAVMLQVSEDVPMSEWQRVYPVLAETVKEWNGK